MNNIQPMFKPGYVVVKGDDTFLVAKFTPTGGLGLVNLRTSTYNLIGNIRSDVKKLHEYRVIAKNFSQYHNLINGVEE